MRDDLKRDLIITDYVSGGMMPEDIPKIKKDAIDAIKISALKMMSKDQIKVGFISLITYISQDFCSQF